MPIDTPTWTVTPSTTIGSLMESMSRRRDPLEQLARLEALDEHGELVAADARRRVGVADDGVDAIGEGDDHGVADVVAELVVDRLEAVEVEVQQRDRLAEPVEAGQRLVEVFVEQHAVRAGPVR